MMTAQGATDTVRRMLWDAIRVDKNRSEPGLMLSTFTYLIPPLEAARSSRVTIFEFLSYALEQTDQLIRLLSSMQSDEYSLEANDVSVAILRRLGLVRAMVIRRADISGLHLT